jgi:hypothetical protein
MPELLHVAVFWVFVIVVIRVGVCFPSSLFARILFLHYGPVAVRGEPKIDYLLRCARFRCGWFAQALLAFVGGWIMFRWEPTILESLYFVVLWAVVVPALAAGALVGTLSSLAQWLWLQYLGHTHSAHVSQA